MLPSQILTQAKQKIINPDNFCRYTLAEDKNGRSVGHTSLEACSFCSVGAVLQFIKTDDRELYTKTLDYLGKAVQSFNPIAYSIAHFNDNSEHSAVMRVFDLAIKLATEAGE